MTVARRLRRFDDEECGSITDPPMDLEKAVVLMAHIVLKHGKAYAPILMRLQRELEERRQSDPNAIARKIIQDYTRDGGEKAIF